MSLLTLIFSINFPKCDVNFLNYFFNYLSRRLQAAKEFETELKKESEPIEESRTALNEIIEQENGDANSTKVSL